MKSKRNPVPTADDLCIECGHAYAETHEIFYGPNRVKSIEHGMQIRLCGEHHRGPDGPHMCHERDIMYKQTYQQILEHYHMGNGMSAEDARALFRREFGRNYIG